MTLRRTGPARRIDLVADLGGVSQGDLEEALNIGVGMVALVAPERPAVGHP